ncbi:alpha/beta fold hydrolase [Limnobacter alexandrii]|jgi:non-heme chloroperoxidase|uniref:alpha/beta fold hydrolase n=1 Tax=Limnobacter alexandrii TaxID=2570352 RepID=UPI001107FFBE|nr:alpha/beta hydrolase [Limnobacter alexandrii]
MISVSNRGLFPHLFLMFVALPMAVLLSACQAEKIKSEHVYSTDGAKISFSEYGNPNGQPVLFIHGWSQSKEIWQQQLTAPELQDYRLIAFDLRGHGQSTKSMNPAEYVSGNNWADDLSAVIRKLGLQNITVVAHSYGATVLMDYLSLYGDKNLKAINFVGALKGVGDEFVKGYIGPDFERIKLATSERFNEQIEGVLALAKANYGDTIHRDNYARGVAASMLTPYYVRRYTISRQVDHAATLRSIQVPVLFSHGQFDRAVLVSSSIDMAAIVKGSKVNIYDESSHAPFVTEAEKFNANLVVLLENIEMEIHPEPFNQQ